MPRLHDVMRTGTVLRYHNVKGSEGASPRRIETPGLHKVVRTGTVLRYHFH